MRHAVEYAVLDRAGRVQLPREMTEALGMRDRVRLQQGADHIGVWPDRPTAAERGDAGQPGDVAGPPRPGHPGDVAGPPRPGHPGDVAGPSRPGRHEKHGS